MKRLSDIVKIAENNKECVVLEVTGEPLDLIKIGYFDGDETMMRLTKGGNHICTVWRKNGGSYSWEWGTGGNTIVSDKMTRQGKLIQECIEDDFEICINGTPKAINRTLHTSVEEIKNAKHDIKFMYWESRPNDICCHKNGTFFKHFQGKDKASAYFVDRGYEFTDSLSYVAGTGCIVEEYIIER